MNLCVLFSDRPKSPGVPGEAIAIFVDRRLKQCARWCARPRIRWFIPLNIQWHKQHFWGTLCLHSVFSEASPKSDVNNLACEQAFILSAFLRPREDWRRVGERFFGGLALIILQPLQTNCCAHLFPACIPQSLVLSRGWRNARAESLLMRACSWARTTSTGTWRHRHIYDITTTNQLLKCISGA